jgi:magnesium transporter
MELKYRIESGRLLLSDDPTSPISIFVNPNDDEKRYLIQDLKLDEHTLASALDPDELARLEFEPEHQALIFKSPIKYSPTKPFMFQVASVGAYIFSDRLIFVADADILSLEGIKFPRIPSLRFLVLRLIYRSIHSFLEHLKVISQISDELQSKINTAMENRNLIELFSLQKSLVYYLNFINSNGIVLKRLENYASRIGFTDEEKELLDDIVIENSQCYQQAEIYSNILASLMDARASIVSNNLNVLMKTLNIITIGIMVPTLVVSAFSMNVRIPLSESPNAFYIIMGLALVSVLTLSAIWRFKKW